MISVSSAFQTALANGNPQRMVFSFSNRIISNEDIDIEVGVHFLEEFCSETDLTIGLTPSAEISFDLLNDDGYFDDFGFGTFTAYLGVRTSTATNSSTAIRPTYSISGTTLTVTGRGVQETYELCSLGVFIALRPDVVQNSTISVTANDKMTLFDRDMPEDLEITYPATMKQILQAMCTYLGITLATTSFINDSLSVTEAPAAFENATMREVLGWIAEASGSNARINRAGYLELVWLNEVNKTIDEDNYSEFTHSWFNAAGVDQLHIRNADSTEEEILGSSGDNKYMIQNNPFLRIDDSE